MTGWDRKFETMDRTASNLLSEIKRNAIDYLDGRIGHSTFGMRQSVLRNAAVAVGVSESRIVAAMAR